MAAQEWTRVAADAARDAWDRDLFRLDDPSLDQTWAWGEHSRRLGWTVHRFAARDAAGRARAIAQVLCRSYGPGIRMWWCPGGPVGEVAAWGEGLRAALRRALPGLGHYCRVYPHRPQRSEDVTRLESQGWRRARSRVRSGLTMRLPLSPEPEALLRGLSQNWRHNLRRASRHGVAVRRWDRPPVDEVLAVYRSMEAHKNLRQQFTAPQIASLLETFGERLVIYRADDPAGRLLAVRGCITLNDRAWDMLAASTVEGRGRYASYALFWRLLEHCRGAGVREYDLRGVDPERDRGVYGFKRGTGATLVEHLGEWDWTTHAPLRWAADLAVRGQRARD